MLAWAKLSALSKVEWEMKNLTWVKFQNAMMFWQKNECSAPCTNEMEMDSKKGDREVFPMSTGLDFRWKPMYRNSEARFRLGAACIVRSLARRSLA